MPTVSSHLARARELRVAVIGVAVVGIALAISVIAPLWLLAIGPIVLGVPHLLADFRYCVVRPGFHRERRLWLTAGLPLVALGFGAPLGPRSDSRAWAWRSGPASICSRHAPATSASLASTACSS